MGEALREEIIEYCLAKGLPRSTVYRRLGSEVKRWSALAMVGVKRADKDVAYLPWRKELDEAFSKLQSPTFTFKLSETGADNYKSFVVEVGAKEYSENCRAKVKIIPCSTKTEGSEEFDVRWYSRSEAVVNLNPGESVKVQLLHLALPEDKLKDIERFKRTYSSAPDSEDVKYHIGMRLSHAYESAEKSIAKCTIDTPEHTSGYQLASQMTVLILSVYSKSHSSWSPFLFVNEAWRDANPYPITQYASRKIAWRTS